MSMPAGLDISTFRGAAFVADQGNQPGSGVTATGVASNTVDRVSYSGILEWMPSYALFGNWSIKGQIGGAPVKNSGTSTFGLLDYQALLSYMVIPTVGIEAGGGAQTWINNGGTSAAVSANVPYYLPKDSFFSQVFIGYSHYFLSGLGTDEGRLGVAVTF
jgi:hypothetical protein